MLKESTLRALSARLVPLVVLDDAKSATALARALLKGGIAVMEITFRTDACLDAIRAVRENVKEMAVGAGTVHTVAQAEAAVKAGAGFIVTPGLSPGVTEWCIAHNVDIIPGVATPSEVEAACAYGLSTCKFFPAEAYGGIKTLKALAGPFQGVRFMPTGGIGFSNLASYLDLTNVAAAGGSFMAPQGLIKSGDWDAVSALCRKAVEIARAGKV